MKSIFEYLDYKKFIADFLRSKPARGYGEKSKLARAIRSQPAYVAQVLNGSADFSLEQAEGLNHYFGHTKDESHFFLLLLQFARAGTSTLKTYFKEQMDEILRRRVHLTERLGIKTTLTLETQAIYYSSWYYAAIHLMLGISQFQTRDQLSQALNLPLERVGEILEFLVRAGLIEAKSGGTYQITSARVHIGNESPLNSKHHINWRMKAVQSLDKGKSADLHYSSVITISRSDVIKIKAKLIEAITEIKAITKESKEEEPLCFSLDFFNFL